MDRFSLPDSAGIPEQAFAEVRAFLEIAGYTEERILSAFGVGKLCDLSAPGIRLETQDLLLALFLLGRPFPAFALEFAIPSNALKALIETGLLRQLDGDYYCPVLLYAMHGIWIVSDRLHNLDGTDRNLPDDFVYLAFTTNTAEFLGILPPAPEGSYLDLGCGAGIAALSAAATAREVWGVDIAPRSIRFSEWAARLNGIGHVHFALGDLYAPVRGRTFDCIAAHPPHDPSFRKNGISADGGDDGEQILRRVIEGLPVHLNMGGDAYIAAKCSDRKGAPCEQRVRGWLGDASADFDISILVRRTYGLADILRRCRDTGLPKDEEAFRRLFHDFSVEQYLYASLCVRRHGETRPGRTYRSLALNDSGHAELTAPLRLLRAVR